MTDALAHRGPDGAGIWESGPDHDGAGCMLGHRRLSIIDLSTAGDQPMTDGTGGRDRTIVFNGEIYNFKDLRRDLEQSGETFQSSGDTAVMLRLLALRGTDAVAMLRGMFAFALWDDHARQLLLARDPLGIKPLYICRNPDPHGEWSLMFSSEVRSILAAGLMERPRLDRRAVRSILWNGFVAGPVTAVEGVELLGAGEWRTIDAPGTVRRATYWSIPRFEDGPPVDEAGLTARRRGQRRAAPDRRRAGRHLPVWRHRFQRGRRPGSACERDARPHLHARLRRAGVQRRRDRTDDRPGHRHRPPRDQADGGRLHVGARHRRRHSRSADVRRLELVPTSPRRFARRDSRWRWSAPAATSCSAATPPSASHRRCRPGTAARG